MSSIGSNGFVPDIKHLQNICKKYESSKGQGNLFIAIQKQPGKREAEAKLTLSTDKGSSIEEIDAFVTDTLKAMLDNESKFSGKEAMDFYVDFITTLQPRIGNGEQPRLFLTVHQFVDTFLQKQLNTPLSSSPAPQSTKRNVVSEERGSFLGDIQESVKLKLGDVSTELTKFNHDLANRLNRGVDFLKNIKNRETQIKSLPWVAETAIFNLKKLPYLPQELIAILEEPNFKIKLITFLEKKLDLPDPFERLYIKGVPNREVLKEAILLNTQSEGSFLDHLFDQLDQSALKGESLSKRMELFDNLTAPHTDLIANSWLTKTLTNYIASLPSYHLVSENSGHKTADKYLDDIIRAFHSSFQASICNKEGVGEKEIMDLTRMIKELIQIARVTLSETPSIEIEQAIEALIRDARTEMEEYCQNRPGLLQKISLSFIHNLQNADFKEVLENYLVRY